MVAYYNIAGRKIGSHVLTMGVLGSTFAGAFLALSGGDKKAQQGPPVNAASKDEEKFIQDFIKSVEGGDSKAKH
ncbi:uncharacterized protein TRUGW13939_01933 [Talaromyces rugulosus]|uniref:ATP synthase subunit K, mitochondrial n=1 Tax=Talaromyces rugulosus TaxID=121627 RepID=A0A7H8QLU0_TALRU|nr:uncharacterized protein TRUGW13939_01933 [Talaromyces rugulosus]QKX54844.1 hypothetical protein TRUGW13939_01933 [Talaromyces rugulosus]